MVEPTTPRTYPPHGHLIRHLGMQLLLETPDLLTGQMPVPDDLRDAGGAARVGAIATFVDVAAGVFSHDTVRPDWIATTDMRLLMCRHTYADEITLATTMLRSGKRNIVSATSVYDSDGEIARGWVTYSRLSRRDDSPHLEGGSRVGQPQDYTERGELAAAQREPLDEYVGLEIGPDDTDGRITLTLEHTPRIHNSFGSLQGGAAAILLERAATLAVERKTGQPGRVDDLHIYYLGQTREGPFKVEATPLRSDTTGITTEARVLDAGNEMRLLDLGTATARPIEAMS